MSHGFSPNSGGSYGSPDGGFASPSQRPAGGPGASPAGFGVPSPAGGSGARRTTSAPVHCLIPSLVLAVVAVIINAWLTFGPATATEGLFAALAAVAWGLAGVLGVTALSWYFITDNKRRGAGFYTEIGWKKLLFAITAAGLIIGVVWSAIDFALWVGKL